MKKRRKLKFLLAVVSLLLTWFGIDYFYYPYGNDFGGRSFDQGENGIWLRYTWYFGEHSANEGEDLALQLGRAHVKYAFFHVRSVEPNGKLNFRYPSVAALNKVLR